MLCVQPVNAGGLFADTGGGLPQRFLWFSSVDPSIPDDPPEWPGKLKWTPPALIDRQLELAVPPEIQQQIRARHISRQRGLTTGLDAHCDLSKLKLAALFAFLSGRQTELTNADWHIAEAIYKRSVLCREGTRTALADLAARTASETTQRKARSAVFVEAAVKESEQQRALDGMARTIGKKLQKAGGQALKIGVLRTATAGQHRQVASFDDALAIAESHGWAVSTGYGWVAGKSNPS